MALAEPLLLAGAPGSPYTRKMLALLRYRRLPYRVIWKHPREMPDMPQPRPALLPTFYLPDADGALRAVVDSTPLIARFDDAYPERRARPANPVVRFLDDLLEDYADEWLTKAMFHYRWHYEADIARAGSILPRWRVDPAPEERMVEMGKIFSERQISRLYVVGSNQTTAPIIEASYERFLDLFRAHLEVSSFLLGRRPAAADFAVFGQLTALTHFDPTPMALTLQRAPRVYAWVDLVEDLSGLDPAEEDWISPDAVPPTLTALLGEVGRVYVPFLLANAAAIASGAEQVDTEIDGARWVQPPFPYQAKCLTVLREKHAALTGPELTAVDAILRGTGCERLFDQVAPA